MTSEPFNLADHIMDNEPFEWDGKIWSRVEESIPAEFTNGADTMDCYDVMTILASGMIKPIFLADFAPMLWQRIANSSCTDTEREALSSVGLFTYGITEKGKKVLGRYLLGEEQNP